MEGTNYATYNPGLNDSSAPTNNEELRNGGSDNFNNEAEGNCNLIVNYLPYEIDDVTLRVSKIEFFIHDKLYLL